MARVKTLKMMVHAREVDGDDENIEDDGDGDVFESV